MNPIIQVWLGSDCNKSPVIRGTYAAGATAEAVARGVWGVPTFDVGGELFWGADSFPMMLDYLQHPDLFDTPEMKRLESLPIGAARA